MTRRIPLRVSNNKVYVWDIDGSYFAPFAQVPPSLTLFHTLDIGSLRADHHICGVLTGTLPHLSQQNVFLGAPLLLMPEEVVLLVDKRKLHHYLLSVSRLDFTKPLLRRICRLGR